MVRKIVKFGEPKAYSFKSVVLPQGSAEGTTDGHRTHIRVTNGADTGCNLGGTRMSNGDDMKDIDDTDDVVFDENGEEVRREDDLDRALEKQRFWICGRCGREVATDEKCIRVHCPCGDNMQLVGGSGC